MDIDYTKWPPGVALAEKVILDKCVRCGKSCHAKKVGRGVRYVHAGRIYRRFPKAKANSRRTRVRNAVEILRSCR